MHSACAPRHSAPTRCASPGTALPTRSVVFIGIEIDIDRPRFAPSSAQRMQQPAWRATRSRLNRPPRRIWTRRVRSMHGKREGKNRLSRFVWCFRVKILVDSPRAPPPPPRVDARGAGLTRTPAGPGANRGRASLGRPLARVRHTYDIHCESPGAGFPIPPRARASVIPTSEL
jgi:hypothetical protein